MQGDFRLATGPITGGVHGDEFEPMAVIRRLAREIPAKYAGMVIVLHTFPRVHAGDGVAVLLPRELIRSLNQESEEMQPAVA